MALYISQDRLTECTQENIADFGIHFVVCIGPILFEVLRMQFLLKKGRLHQITFLLCLIFLFSFLISREQQEGISNRSDALENNNSLLSNGPNECTVFSNFLARNSLENCFSNVCYFNVSKG